MAAWCEFYVVNIKRLMSLQGSQDVILKQEILEYPTIEDQTQWVSEWLKPFQNDSRYDGNEKDVIRKSIEALIDGKPMRYPYGPRYAAAHVVQAIAVHTGMQVDLFDSEWQEVEQQLDQFGMPVFVKNWRRFNEPFPAFELPTNEEKWPVMSLVTHTERDQLVNEYDCVKPRLFDLNHGLDCFVQDTIGQIAARELDDEHGMVWMYSSG